MKVKSRNHVYECLPQFLDNRKLPADEQVVIGLKVVSQPERDDYQQDLLTIRLNSEHNFAEDKAREMIDQQSQERSMNLFRSKFCFVKGLEIEGFEGKELDFDTFYAEAPPELVNWATRTIMSTTELTLAERKNFLPGSDSAS